MDAQVLRRRFARAAAVCAMAFVVMAMVLLRQDVTEVRDELGAHAGDPNPMSASTYASQVWQGVNSGKSEEDALADAGFSVHTSGAAAFPHWFESEVFELAEGQRLVLDQSGALANVIFQSRREEAMSFVDAALRQNGWTKIEASEQPAGEEGMHTSGGQMVYQKKGGTCRWLMLTPIEAEGETSVTMHIQRV